MMGALDEGVNLGEVRADHAAMHHLILVYWG